MCRFTWNRWLRMLDGGRARPKAIARRLALTHLEQRETPAAFAPGDVVVYRVGAGATLTAGAATAAFLDEYSPTGTLVQSIALPTANIGSNLALTASGTQAGTTILGDGSLTDSTDGRYLLAVGYNATPGTTGVVGLTSATNPRVIARIDSNGNVDTSTAITNGYSANNIDDAASPDGVAIWTGGFDSSGSVRQTTFGTNGAATAINTGTSAFSKSNSRIVSVGNNQIYGSNSTTNIDGVFSVGTGLSTTSGQPSTILNGFPTAGSTGTPAQFANPYQYIFNGPNTVYVADARTNGNGGLQKWTFDGTFWNLQYTIKGNAIPNTAYTNGTFTQPQLFEGLIGLVGNFSGPNPVFYGITSETTSTTLGGTNSTNNGAIPQDHLVQIVDMGSATASTENVLATAGTNEIFRGAAFAPTPVGTTADAVAVNTSGTPVSIGTAVTFTATVTAASSATGYITFEDTSTTPATTLGVVALAPATGTTAQAQVTTSSLGVGNHTIEAIYGGDSTYLTGNNTTSQVITGTNTTTGVASNTPLPTAAGVVVTFTATINPSTGSVAPTGTVTFYDNGLPINTTPITPTASGATDTATVTETTNAIQGTSPLLLTPGSHTITAVFTATGDFVSSSNSATPLIQNVKPNPFGPGDLLVYRAGDGVTALTPGGGATGNVVYIDEFTTAAGQTTPVQSIVMPTTSIAGGNQALVTTAQQSTEGQISLSGDGQYVFLTGYDTPPGGIDPHTSAAATTPRTIGRISYNGTIDTSMALTDAADGGSIHGVVSPDGNQVYVTGSTGGIRYVPNYAAGLTTSTQIDTDTTLNELEIAGGQLYVSGTTPKVSTVGTGLPTTTGQTLTILPSNPATGAGSFGSLIGPQGFFFTKLEMGPTVGPDTLYIADNGTSFADGTITKWSLVSGNWVLNDTITSGPSSDNPTIPSFDNITGVTTGGTVAIYGSYGNGGSANGPADLFSFSDSGGYNAPVPSHTATTLASVATGGNEEFRGVAVVPTQAVVAPTVAGVSVSDGVAADGTTQRSEVRQVTVTFSSPVTFTGGNSNAAAAFQLKHLADGNNVALAAAVGTNGSGQTTVTLTFSGAETDPISAENPQHLNPAPLPSLADGLYQLTILSADVSGAGGLALAGGGAGGNYVSPTDTLGGGAGELGLYRLFGDATGNGVVDQLDLAQFRAANNSTGPGAPYISYLDADNSGTIDQIDLAQFRARNNSNVFGV